MPRILLYTIDYPPQRGGVARYLSTMAEYFGSEMDVAVPEERHRRWWTIALDLIARRSTYRTIVVSHVLPVGTGAMLAKIVTRRPYVVVVHGMDVGLAKRNALKRLVAWMVLRGAKAVVANSVALEKEVRDAFGVERTVVVYPTVAQTPPNLPLAGEETRRGGLRVLTVARLVPRKGHLRVLEALVRLRERYPDLLVTYTIVGDGPMREEIKAGANERGLTNVTIVTDATDTDLASHYASSDVLVMPVVRDDEDREGFGMVYIEAASYGVPSIATHMPGVDEAVVNGQTGILVPDGDIAALADAVYGLASDPERRRQLGEAARRRVSETFVPDVQFSKLTPIL